MSLKEACTRTRKRVFEATTAYSLRVKAGIQQEKKFRVAVKTAMLSRYAGII